MLLALDSLRPLSWLPRLGICVLVFLPAGCQLLPGGSTKGSLAGIAAPAVVQRDQVPDDAIGDADEENPARCRVIQADSDTTENVGIPAEKRPETSAPERKSELYALTSGDELFSNGIDPPPGGRLTFPDEPDGSSDDPPPAADPRFEPDDEASPQADEPPAAEDIRFTLRDDVRELFPNLVDDAASVITWKNALVLGAAAGASVAIRQNLDGQVREETAEHYLRWGNASRTLRLFGEPEIQVPIIFGVYGLSLWTQDEELHNFTKAMISAHAISSLATVAIKGVTNTSRPTTEFMGGHYGFPSYHTSSCFAIAATIEEYYGWQAGVPAYLLSGLVGWSRIDQREHDLSDVLFGAVLGYVVGKSVAATHLNRDRKFEVKPFYSSTTAATGVAVEVPF